jgi:hypothetical protein
MELREISDITKEYSKKIHKIEQEFENTKELK